MAKRFTDTDKYKDPFLRSLPGPYKLLWDFLYHECDHAALWHPDFEIAQIYIGKDMPVEPEYAIKLFNAAEERVIILPNGKWFIPRFIEQMYKVPIEDLNPDNRVHSSVLSMLIKEGASKPLIENNKPLDTHEEGAKNKNKNKNKNVNKNLELEGGVGGDGGQKTDEPRQKPTCPDENRQTPPQYPRDDEFQAAELNAQAEHSFHSFIAVMPQVNGKHLDLEACRGYWAKNPAKWRDWLLTVRNYAESDRVKRGIGICNPMTFLTRVYLDWFEPEQQPLGDGARMARDALRTALLDKKNTHMPKLPDEAEALFYEKGIPWAELREQVLAGKEL